MTDLLNYLNYKQHDYHFHFNFLQESRFILNHELILAELELELSLEFVTSTTPEIYILHNHKKQTIEKIISRNCSAVAYLVPTTHPHIQLFLMQGQ
jgi:hypothetical protein